MQKILCMVALLSLFLIAAGCQSLSSLGPSPQVPLSSANKEMMTLDQLRQQWANYNVFYSWSQYNPSAVLFIPKNNEYTLKLLDQGVNRWYSVHDQQLLTQVIRRLDDNQYGGVTRPRLQAVLTPPLAATGQREFLAYIFTNGYLSLDQVQSKDRTYALEPVPEQFNPAFHNEMGGFK